MIHNMQTISRYWTSASFINLNFPYEFWSSRLTSVSHPPFDSFQNPVAEKSPELTTQPAAATTSLQQNQPPQVKDSTTPVSVSVSVSGSPLQEKLVSDTLSVKTKEAIGYSVAEIEKMVSQIPLLEPSSSMIVAVRIRIRMSIPNNTTSGGEATRLSQTRSTFPFLDHWPNIIG